MLRLQGLGRINAGRSLWVFEGGTGRSTSTLGGLPEASTDRLLPAWILGRAELQTSPNPKLGLLGGSWVDFEGSK